METGNNKTSSLMMCLVTVWLVVGMLSGTSSLAIYRDSEIFRKAQQRGGGRQLNDLLYEDDYPIAVSRYGESRWESAEWPLPEEMAALRGGGSYDSYESNEDKPMYNWFYHNKYVNNGVYNDLYNGPKVDMNAGVGTRGSNHNPPRILPRPAPVMRSL